ESSSSDSGASRASRALRSRWGKVAAVAVVAIAVAAASAYVLRASNQAPTITQATVSSEFATTGQSLTFAGQATDADGDSLRYTWNFGDNSTAIGAVVSHAYSIPGRYVDLLTVTDGRGGEATNDARLLFVQAQLPPSEIASPSRPPNGSCATDCILGPGAAILTANQTTVVTGAAVRTVSGVKTLRAGYTSRVTHAVPVAVLKHPGVFTTATFGEPDSLDPAADIETAGVEILQNVYETLVWYEPGVENVTVLVPR